MFSVLFGPSAPEEVCAHHCSGPNKHSQDAMNYNSCLFQCNFHL